MAIRPLDYYRQIFPPALLTFQSPGGTAYVPAAEPAVDESGYLLTTEDGYELLTEDGSNLVVE